MEACDCGEVHLAVTPPLQLVEAALARGVPRSGPVTLPDGRTFMVPRVYVAAHGLDPTTIPDLARRYGWAQTR